MDKKYFIASGKDHLGPFSLSELQEKKLNPDTLIWSEDLVQWTKAENITELKSYVIPIPPPTPEEAVKRIKKDNIQRRVSDILRIGLFTIIVFVVLIIGIYAVAGGFINTTNTFHNEFDLLEPYCDMGIYVGIGNVKQVLFKTSLFWSFIFSGIYFVLCYWTVRKNNYKNKKTNLNSK